MSIGFVTFPSNYYQRIFRLQMKFAGEVEKVCQESREHLMPTVVGRWASHEKSHPLALFAVRIEHPHPPEDCC